MWGRGWEGIESHFDSKFHGNIWINLINSGYCIYHKYTHPYFLPYTSLLPFIKFILLSLSVCKIAE